MAFTASAQAPILFKEFEKDTFELTATSPRDNELTGVFDDYWIQQ